MSPATDSPRAVVLLSGGLDSATTAAIARSEGFAVHALSFRYGQRHAGEIQSARRVAAAIGAAEHVVAEIDPRAFGGSALTDGGPVPHDRPLEQIGEGVPTTYVPARNTIFLAYALGWAEVLGARDIFIGANAVDYSGYPDCRPEFLEAFERVANLGTRAGIEEGAPFRVRAPLLRLSKCEIILRGHALGVDYGLTSSCYDPSPAGEACGTCDACRLRLNGFREAELTDPVRYRTAV